MASGADSGFGRRGVRRVRGSHGRRTELDELVLGKKEGADRVGAAIGALEGAWGMSTQRRLRKCRAQPRGRTSREVAIGDASGRSQRRRGGDAHRRRLRTDANRFRLHPWSMVREPHGARVPLVDGLGDSVANARCVLGLASGDRLRIRSEAMARSRGASASDPRVRAMGRCDAPARAPLSRREGAGPSAGLPLPMWSAGASRR